MTHWAGLGQTIPGPEFLGFYVSMFMANAVVMVVDRLGAGYLGPYGNTWIETPSCNRLAAHSALFEWALTDAVDLRTVYRSYWRGLHALCPERSIPSLPEVLAAGGIHCVLVTDEPQLLDFPGQEAFAERIVLTPAPVEDPATEVVQTQMAQLLAAATAQLERMPEPFLLWIHSRGMAGAWDGPAELRNQFADEEDPAPPDLVAPPVKRFDSAWDPDELLGYQHAYAGQVALLDLCLEPFLESAQATAGWDRTLLALTSPRGYPLGEHGWVGASDAVVYEEQVHVPCLIRLPHDRHAGVRCQQLVQPPDLCASLWETFQLPPDSEGRWGRSLLALADAGLPCWRDRAATAAPAAQALRTPAWLLVRQQDGRHELFVKPHDRWEVNEVADRCLEAVEQLSAAWSELAHIAQSPQAIRFTPLSELLLESID
jgi:arylsulfatase A-like enzyme